MYKKRGGGEGFSGIPRNTGWWLGAIGTTGAKGAPDDGGIFRFAGAAFVAIAQDGAVVEVSAGQGHIVHALFTLLVLLLLGLLEHGGDFLQIGAAADVPVVQGTHAAVCGRHHKEEKQEGVKQEMNAHVL